MEEKLLEIIGTLNFPAIRQGSLGPGDEYPDNFFTYWNNGSFDQAYYNNTPTERVFSYDVNFYSSSPNTAFEKLREAITKLKAEGFIVNGDGSDVPSDEVTHTGRGTTAMFILKL